MARAKKDTFTAGWENIIMLENPEVHIGCFTILRRDGHNVVCDHCQMTIATTEGYYQNAHKEVIYDPRQFSRGHARGRNKSQK
jgi:hypothetical protein